MMAAAVAAVIGHVFPVWLGFKGGKGVATGLGVIPPDLLASRGGCGRGYLAAGGRVLALFLARLDLRGGGHAGAGLPVLCAAASAADLCEPGHDLDFAARHRQAPQNIARLVAGTEVASAHAK